jgi:hypothetical protein
MSMQRKNVADLAVDELIVSARLTPTERLREAISWNRLASQAAIAGKQARRERHPATRRGEK